MRIRTKILLNYLVTGILIAFGVGFSARQMLQHVDADYDHLFKEDIPVIHSLEQIKVAALRIVPSTNEAAILRTHSSLPGADEAAERALISGGVTQLKEALTMLEALYRVGGRREEAFRALALSDIREASAALLAQSTEFLSMPAIGSSSDIVERKEAFEGAEKRFLHILDDTLQKELRAMRDARDDVRSLLADSLRSVMTICGAILVFSLFYGLSLARLISGPIHQLQRAVIQIRDGVYWRRIGIHSNDEVGALARGFEEMVSKLLFAKELAEDASRVKSDFLANINHELRTPLNGIMGISHLLLEKELESELRTEIETIHSQSHRLLELLNDTIDFGTITVGGLKVQSNSFHLRALIEEVAKYFKQQTKAKGIALLTQVGADIPDTLRGDSLRIIQVLKKLVGNAVKFTEKGTITLRVQGTATLKGTLSLQFEIVDTGIGIPLEKQGSLFQAFSQVDSSTSRRHEGAGLGLALSSQLVEMMGGTIQIDSVFGKGSTFRFSIPLEVIPSAAVVETTPAVQKGLPQQRTPLHVLVAEDNPVNQRILQRLLEKAGHTVSLAVNGKEVLRFLEGGGYFDPSERAVVCDVVLMDIQMPEMGGVEATEQIREREKTTGKHIPIIAVTAHALEGHREEYLRAGMDGYVPKPINVKQLMDAIDHVPKAT